MHMSPNRRPAIRGDKPGGHPDGEVRAGAYGQTAQRNGPKPAVQGGAAASAKLVQDGPQGKHAAKANAKEEEQRPAWPEHPPASLPVPSFFFELQ